MRFSDRLSLSMRMFTTRTRRTALTILGVGVGIGAVLFLVSLGYGLQRLIIEQITTADSLLSMDVSAGRIEALAIDDSTATTLAKVPHVVEVVRTKNLPGRVALGDLVTDSTVRAVDPAFLRLAGTEVDRGAPLADPTGRDLVVSSATLALLGIEPDRAIGTQLTVTVNPSPTDGQATAGVPDVQLTGAFTIRGVVTDEGASYVYAPVGAVGVDAPIPVYDALKVKVASQEFTRPVRDALLGLGYQVSALSDVVDEANRIFGIVQIVLGAFGLIALAVSAIGMFNTMTIALLERTNEIGIMRSVGVSPRDIRQLFLTEAMLMGGLGGLSGILLAYLGGIVVNVLFNLLATRLGGEAVNLFFSPPWFVAVILGFSTLIGFITGIFPALRASRMDPLEALRYK